MLGDTIKKWRPLQHENYGPPLGKSCGAHNPLHDHISYGISVAPSPKSAFSIGGTKDHVPIVTPDYEP
ncbi:MAG: hypothetical protein ABJA60_08685 [Nitrosospira sp.]